MYSNIKMNITEIGNNFVAQTSVLKRNFGSFKNKIKISLSISICT